VLVYVQAFIKLTSLEATSLQSLEATINNSTQHLMLQHKVGAQAKLQWQAQCQLLFVLANLVLACHATL